jgi:hypothetical protein
VEGRRRVTRAMAADGSAVLLDEGTPRKVLSCKKWSGCGTLLCCALSSQDWTSPGIILSASQALRSLYYTKTHLSAVNIGLWSPHPMTS